MSVTMVSRLILNLRDTPGVDEAKDCGGTSNNVQLSTWITRSLQLFGTGNRRSDDVALGERPRDDEPISFLP